LYPIIFDFGRFSLHTYGLAMAIAFGAGIYLAMRRADKCEMGSKFALDLSYLILVFSLVGARFTYVITHWSEFKDYPLDIISPVQHTGQIGIAGLVLLGGVIGGFATAYIYSRRKGHAFLAVTDLFIPSLILGIAVGRLGCFFNGCCFGTPTDLPWCMHFPKDSFAGGVFPEQCIHPTQLYEFLYMMILFPISLWYAGKKHAVGVVTGWFLLLYGIGRYIIEGLRWYESEMILFQAGDYRFTFSRLISVAMILLGAYLLLTRRKVTPPPTEKTQQGADV
jgi:phosphatidylglycerol---prolipoprotein diacylglyceryl transferase